MNRPVSLRYLRLYYIYSLSQNSIGLLFLHCFANLWPVIQLEEKEKEKNTHPTIIKIPDD